MTPARAAALLVLVGALNLALVAFDPRLETWNDNAEFVLLARSIASGQGYALHDSGVAVPHARLPPGFPALLAPLALLGADLVTLKVAVLATYVVACLALLALAARWLTLPAAMLATALFAANWLVLTFASQIMSEVPYVALSLLALAAVERARDGSERWWATACGLATAAYLVRTSGLALLGALFVSAVLARAGRRALVVAAIASLAVVPWSVRGRLLGLPDYGRAFALADWYRPELGTVDAAGLAARVVANARGYPRLIAPVSLDGRLLERSWHAPLFVGLLVGFAAWSARSRRPEPALYLAFYTALLFVVPNTMMMPRYLVPVVPFVAIAVAGATQAALRRPRLVAVAALIVLAPYVPQELDALRGISYGYPDASFAAYYTLGDLLREAPGEPKVWCRKPQLTHLASGRRTVLWPEADPARFVERLRQEGVTHVLESRLELPWEEHAARAVSGYPAAFRLVREASPHRLWEVR